MNKKLLIIVSTVVVVLGVFFVIYKKATGFKYELTTNSECVKNKKSTSINCECDVLFKGQHYKANTAIDVESCDNHEEFCKNLCETHVKDLDK